MFPRRFVVTSLILCVAVAGCSDSSPTSPGGGGAGGQLYTSVRFNAVIVHADGDALSDGEFDFRWGVNQHEAFRSVSLGTDDVWGPPQQGWQVVGEGSSIKIHFEATEWDKDLLGRDVRDSDMSRKKSTKSYTVAPPLNQNRQYSITLGNSDCKVELLYTLFTYRR